MTDHERNTAEETITETIDGSEEVCDPLEGLVEKTRIDPGAPFTPEVLERLAALKKDDRAAFEKLRAQLKDAGCCRVTALDEALAEESGGAGGREPTQADILIDLRKLPSYSTPLMAPVSLTSTSTVIAKPGRSAPRAFATGSSADSSRKLMARQIPKPCSQRSR
jgi:hypothetical protein